MLISSRYRKQNTAPPRNKMEGKKKAVKAKAGQKSSKTAWRSNGILVVLSVSIAVLAAVYYTRRNPSKEDATRPVDGVDDPKRNGHAPRDPHLDFTVLPRLDGVKVCNTAIHCSLMQYLYFSGYCVLAEIRVQLQCLSLLRDRPYRSPRKGGC